MEFKEKQKVIFENKVWKIDAVTTIHDAHPYLIVRKNIYHWVSDVVLQPLESRKALRKQIKELAEINDKHQNRIMELEQQLAAASEAVQIVKAIENMPRQTIITKTDGNWFDITVGKPGHIARTLILALTSAGLLQPKESNNGD